MQTRYLAERATCFCGTVTRMVYAATRPRNLREFIIYCSRHQEKRDAAKG